MDSNVDSFNRYIEGRGVRWIGGILLFLVAYVHFALFFSMLSFRLLPILFLINGVGALVALVGVMLDSRWAGWLLGIVVAGGAAIAKIAMNTIPGVGAFLMGTPSGLKMPRPPVGHKGFSGEHFGGHMPHGILPLFTSIGNLVTISIIIELIFVLLAAFVLITKHENLEVTSEHYV